MAVEGDALMFGAQQANTHVTAHSPEADHSDLHVSCAPGVGLRLFGVVTFDFGDIGSTNREPASRYQEPDTGKDAGGSPAPIPCASLNCRATPRIAGNRRAKMQPPTKQLTPP